MLSLWRWKCLPKYEDVENEGNVKKLKKSANIRKTENDNKQKSIKC